MDAIIRSPIADTASAISAKKPPTQTRIPAGIASTTSFGTPTALRVVSASTPRSIDGASEIAPLSIDDDPQSMGDASEIAPLPMEDGSADTCLIPDHLAAKFDALPKTTLFAKPVGPEGNHQARIGACVATLHHNGWTLGEAIGLAPYFPLGFGALGEHAATVIRKEWNDRLARLAKEAEARAKRAELLSRTSAVALLRREFQAEEYLLGSLVTRTTRTFIVGATGAGKTILALAMAAGMASGQGFLNWRSDRPARVLYIDGEMPLLLLQARLRDITRRMASEDAVANVHLVSWQDADTLLPETSDAQWASLNAPEGQQFVQLLCELIKPDVVIFDNVQSLIAGDMKDEVPWNDTMPLVLALTARSIGQVWIYHTGHDTTRQYGASRKAWQFDNLGIIAPLADITEQAPGELAFSLSFDAPGKCRRRTPDNWQEFAPCVIRLRDDRWTVDGASPGAARAATKVSPLTKRFHEALNAVTAGGAAPGLPNEATRDAWEASCIERGLIEPPGDREKYAERDRRRAKFRKAQSELLAAKMICIEGSRVMDLTRVWGAK